MSSTYRAICMSHDAAKPPRREPIDVIRAGQDAYVRDDLCDTDGVWHYRVVPA